MTIRIEKIAVRNLGPLGDFDMDMGDFNLVYGWNETGKTYLVEFLLRSIFRGAARWGLRDAAASGRITVSGVHEEPVVFTPQSEKKLEDYWDQDERGLPADMARLLVVKGAELSIDRDRPGGVSRKILRSYLSRNELVDQIFDKITVTLREAKVVAGAIEGSRRTDIRTRERSLEDLERIEKLFERIDLRYAGGPRRELELQKESLEQERQRLVQAKRHLAYSLDQDIKERRRERERLPDSELKKLRSDFDAYQRGEGARLRTEELLQSLSEEREDYGWLEQAIRVYESRGLQRAAGPRLALLFSGCASLIGSVVALLLNSTLLGLVLFVIGAILLGVYVYRLHRQVDLVQESEELQRLSRDYEARFGDQLGSLAELKRRKSQLEETHIRARGAEDRYDEVSDEIEGLSEEISGRLRSLTDEDCEIGDWQQVITELEEQAEELDREIREREIGLAELGVQEEEYSTEEPAEDFDSDHLDLVEEELDTVEEQLRRARDNLRSLKQEICNETRENISTPWPEVLESLQRRRTEVEDDYRQVTARILAQIAVTDVLEEIRESENEKIREGLNLDGVTAPLLRITGRYESLSMVDDNLSVSTRYRDYPLSDLSTGAQEQVLLALRMGFASHLAGGEPLFLVLDDAFQYADWERRSQLVDEVAGLTESGWQIIYLTMDDHLRDLFLETGNAQFGEAFSHMELKPQAVIDQPVQNSEA